MDRPNHSFGLLASAFVAAAGLCAPLGAIVASSTAASAQVTEIDPYYAVVRESNVNLRCGAGQVWYAVGKVDKGQVLRVDGHEFGWLRVGYPTGMAAVVRANDAEYDSSVGAVTLIRESRLLASNPAGGVADSWRQLLDEPLPTDTVLEHLETLRNSSGEVEGYRVVAPGAAKGFVSETLVRMATEDEVQRFLAGPTLTEADEADAPAQDRARRNNDEPPEAVAARTAADLAEETAEVADTRVADAANETDDDLAERDDAPMRRDARAPEQQEGLDERAEPTRETVNRFPPPAADSDPRDPRDPRQTSETRGETAETTSQPISAGGERSEQSQTRRGAEAPPASYAELNLAFEEVMRQPTQGAEYSPLIQEFQRFLDTLPDEPGADAHRAAARGRIEALRLRADLQASMLEMSEALAAADRGSEEVQQRAETLEANPIYRFVGRLGSSTVYNGERLPLLYRVQAVDSGRTIAYLTPDPELDLVAKLGSVVGVVVSQSREDRTLGLPLVDARRVDIIRSQRDR